ncbi:hypothetical protein LRP88_14474 [Fusarium phalaenopsidis]
MLESNSTSQADNYGGWGRQDESHDEEDKPKTLWGNGHDIWAGCHGGYGSIGPYKSQWSLSPRIRRD